MEGSFRKPYKDMAARLNGVGTLACFLTLHFMPDDLMRIELQGVGDESCLR